MRADEARNDVVNTTEVEEPQEYVCIITQELMENPVIAEDGYSYEKESIVRWMREHRNQSPMIRQAMDPGKLINQVATTLANTPHVERVTQQIIQERAV